MVKPGPMHILESNHKTAKPLHVLIGQLPNHGHLKKVKAPKSLKGSRATVTWHIECSSYLLRRLTNWEREGEGGKAPNPPSGEETPYVHIDHGIMGTTKFESHYEDTIDPCMNEKCNVLLE